MTLMNTEVIVALRDAQSVSEEKTRKAAEAIATFEQRLFSLDRGVDVMARKITVAQWLSGSGLALNVAVAIEVLAG